MTLIKRKVIGLDDEPHTGIDWGLVALLIVCIIGAFFVVFTFTSCNPTTHAYKAIEKHEPKKPEDSARLLKRAAPLLHTPAPIVKQGKTIVRTVKVPEKIKVLDTAKLKAVTDSVILQYTKDGIEITKDCEQSVKQALDKGIKQGYQLAIHDMGDLTIQDKDPDTVFLPNDSLAAVLALTVIERNKAQQEAIKQSAKKDTYRGIMWILLVISFVSGAIAVKSFMKPKVVKYPEL